MPITSLISFLLECPEWDTVNNFPIVDLIEKCYPYETKEQFEVLFKQKLSELENIKDVGRNTTIIEKAKKLKADNYAVLQNQLVLEYWKLKLVRSDMRSTALNFHVSSAAVMNNVSEEVLKSNKREGEQVSAEKKKTKTTTTATKLEFKELYTQGGEGPYVFTHNSIIWRFKSINISSELNNFRSKCLNRIIGKTPSFVEELALNGIYYINKAANEGFYDIDQDVWSELVKESYAEFKHLEGTVVDSNTFDDIFKSFRDHPKNSIAQASSWYASSDELTNDNITAKALFDITTKLNQFNNTYQFKESLFQSLFVEPLFTPFILSSTKHRLKGNTDESEGSKDRRKSYGRMPDLAVEITHSSYSQCIFLCEIKSPAYMSKHPESHPDKVKLINLMKDELDRAHAKYTANGRFKVYGALVEGHRIKIYAMDLKYSAIYRLFKLNEEFIPRSKYDLDTLRNTLSSCLMLKNGIAESSKKCVEIFKTVLDPPCTPPVKQPLSLVSFVSPYHN